MPDQLQEQKNLVRVLNIRIQSTVVDFNFKRIGVFGVLAEALLYRERLLPCLVRLYMFWVLRQGSGALL